MSEDPLFPFYKRARNRLRQCEPESFVNHAINALHHAHRGGIDALRKYQPWNLLLSIKWALQEADSLSHRRRSASENDLRVVINIMHELDGSVRMPSDFEHAILFMRQLAFQQFWLQNGRTAEALVRQDYLFSDLPQGHQFRSEFRRLTGIECADFIDISFAVVMVILQSAPRLLAKTYFQPLAKSLPVGALDAFFAYLSKSISELHVWLATDEFRNISVADQRILPSPLVSAPLIRDTSANYTVTSPALLLRSLESVVYRTLRAVDPAQFGARFGPIFERYVERCLADAGLDFRNEAWLKAQSAEGGKCVDFLVYVNDAAVLIDAKAIEMSVRGRVSQRPDLVLSAIKDSALKAVEQGMATVRRLSERQSGIRFPSSESTYLLVVTFDNLYLGSSAEFAPIFGRFFVPKLERQFGVPLPIALENIFFITIDELERLLARVRDGAGTLVEILRHARRESSSNSTRKFLFQQHLDSFSTQENRLPLLEARLDTLIHRCSNRLLPE